MKQPSLVGTRYLLNFIDDFSKDTWVYLLINKDNVFKRFKGFRELVENQCN
jgi:hypothetical protein